MTRRASLFTGRLRRRQTMVTRHLLPRSFQALTPGASWVFVRLSCGVLLGSLFVATMPGAFCASCRIDCSRRCRCTPLSSGPNGTGMRRPSESRRFLPHIDNWATCDQLPIKALECRPEETLARVERWLASGRCYTMRFAIRVLMVQFLDERFEPRFLDMVAEAHLAGERSSDLHLAGGRGADAQYTGECGGSGASALAGSNPRGDTYCLNMMCAWYLAEAVVKQPKTSLPYLERPRVSSCAAPPRPAPRRMDPPQGHP